MRNSKPHLLLLAASLLMLSFSLPAKKIKVYMVGDSTMSQKEVKAYPETGWGMPFGYFFNENVRVENHAKNGRSTRSFLEENRWQPILDSLKEGDYVFVQFGHNDESKTKVATYTNEDDYRKYLLKYVSETRNKKANPVLVTPVSRRNFDSEGMIKETHLTYSAIVREVAKAQNVPLVDLDKESQALLQKFGPEHSKLLFLQLAPGEHPNYPSGKVDNTHFNELGARLMAQIVLAQIRKLKLDLVNHLAEPLDKNK
jgi:lysophospholipase L1-like esterase